MKKIAVVGSGIAGVRAVEEIRLRDKESEIVIFCEEGCLPYQPHLFGDLLSKAIREENLFYKAPEFYKSQNIRLVTDKKIQRVDLKKKRITTEDKEQHSFDVLLINTTAAAAREIKGVNKKGVFSLRKLADLKDAVSILHLIETVVIDGSSALGVSIACGFKKRNKDVVLVAPSAFILPHLVDKESASSIEKHLEENQIRVIRDNAITEILGEGDVKALRLKSGKVLAAQAVILDNQKPDLRLWNDTGLEIKGGICVDECQRTNVENVFALGPSSQRRAGQEKIFCFDDPAIFEEQGRVAGCVICAETTAFAYPQKGFSVNLFDRTVTLALADPAIKEVAVTTL